MNDIPINRREFYRRPEDRDQFFERVMRDAGGAPFVEMGNADRGMRNKSAPRLSSRPRAQQPPSHKTTACQGQTFYPVVVALPDLTRSDQ